MTKKCSRCCKIKPKPQFYKWSGICKPCKIKDGFHYRNKRKSKDITYYIRLLVDKARTRNKKYNINLDYVLDIWNKQQGLCALSGFKMTNKAAPAFSNVSIDRINPNKGYIKDNIQLVCVGVNKMKSNLTDRKFISICSKIVRNNK